MNSSKSEVPARGDRGLKILEEAFNRGEMVLEFNQEDDGTITVIPIGDHVEELERNNKALRNEIETLKNKLEN